MAEFKQLEYFLLGYVPVALRKQGIEIAICLREFDDEAGKFAGVRFINKWDRVREVDPYADLEGLKELEKDIRNRWPTIEGRQLMVRIFEDSFSNAVQLLKRGVCLS
jgi:hypothetical protein